MQLQVVNLNVLEYIADLGKWNIIVTTLTDQVIDVESVFNQDVGDEVFDDEDLKDDLFNLGLISGEVTFWTHWRDDQLIDYVLVCKPNLEPILKLIRVEGGE